MMYNHNHQYHLVNVSPWPITGALSIMILLTGMTKLFHLKNINLMMIGMIITIFIMYQWWRDMIRESTFQGSHTLKVTLGMKWGMILFITSEILFFISFFWSFFHSSLSPAIELGLKWPPSGIFPFDPFKIPLLNTIILLTSGISVTWAHNSLIKKNFNETTLSLIITIILGIYFSLIQSFEYLEAPFNMSDSSYGASFFMATGFHGIHVIIGTLFLLFCLTRHLNFHFSNIHHFGFEAAAWYWHFIDIVWLLLFISIYWWGSK